MGRRGTKNTARPAIVAVLAALVDDQTITPRDLATRSGFAPETVERYVRQLTEEGDPLSARVKSARLPRRGVARDGFALPSGDEIVAQALRNRNDLDVLWF